MRSEEHTSELQSRFGISYAVFCLKKKKTRRIPLASPDYAESACAVHAVTHSQHSVVSASGALSIIFAVTRPDDTALFFFNDAAPPEISPLPHPALLPT